MNRYYTATLHRRCDQDGCAKSRTHGVRDSRHGEIGRFCETHAKALVAKLNAEEELRSA